MCFVFILGIIVSVLVGMVLLDWIPFDFGLNMLSVACFIY